MDNPATIIRRYYTSAERSDDHVRSQITLAQRVLSTELETRLKPYQYDALISMVTDLVAGLAFAKEGDFHGSRLLVAVNAGMLQIAAAEFFSFVYIRGRVDRRLWEKRNVEQVLFLRGTLLPPTS